MEARESLLNTLKTTYKKSDFMDNNCMVCQSPARKYALEKYEDGSIELCLDCWNQFEEKL